MTEQRRYYDYIGFLNKVGMSKRLLRSGWVEKGIDDPESVADHSFRVTFMALTFASRLEEGLERPLDRNKLVMMALLHDIGEVITGDIITQRGEFIDIIKRDEKELKEGRGVKQIFDMIGEADEFVPIYEEMIARVTPEAQTFWQLDALEMAIQAFEYEREQGKSLREFLVRVQLYHLKHPFLKKMFDSMMEKRRKMWNKRGGEPEENFKVNKEEESKE